MPQNLGGHERERMSALANRLRTLLDVFEVRDGREVTFSEISGYLTGRDIRLSRARWSYMINEHRLVDDPGLLDGLSDFFGVDRAYLRGGEMPESIKAQVDPVRALRIAKVRSYAARTLGDLSPEALRVVTQHLDNEARTLRRE